MTLPLDNNMESKLKSKRDKKATESYKGYDTRWKNRFEAISEGVYARQQSAGILLLCLNAGWFFFILHSLFINKYQNIVFMISCLFNFISHGRVPVTLFITYNIKFGFTKR